VRALASVAAGAGWAARAEDVAVMPALQRPALRLRRPEQAMVLGASHAGARLVVVGERGVVIVSDDDGAQWRQVPVPVSVTLTAVRFVDATHGFAVGHGGAVLSTADGGSTWTQRLDGRQAAQLALLAARAGGDPRVLRQAERLVTDGPDKPFFDLHFHDRDHGLVVGAYNLAFSTADGGRSWQCVSASIDNPGGLHLYAIRARADVMVIAGEQGLVLRSDDRGRSFRRLALPYKGSFFTAEVSDDGGQRLLLAGLRGNVWRCTDGGTDWTLAPLPAQAQASVTGSALAGRQATSDRASDIVLVNQAGQLLRARPDALTLLPGTPLPPLNGVLPLQGDRVLALSVAGPVVRSLGVS
jgi:photosystem II stability/assembly factor-like uncharacterized protein